ncbi:MAG: hypothetical protein Q4F23_06660 [Coriobacteriia bacterium]|nr:hypothetical protein [Coriobacteriia bacterium]
MDQNQDQERRPQPGEAGFTRGGKRTSTYYSRRQSSQAMGDDAHVTAQRLKEVSAKTRTQKSAMAKAAEGNGLLGKISNLFRR